MAKKTTATQKSAATVEDFQAAQTSRKPLDELVKEQKRLLDEAKERAGYNTRSLEAAVKSAARAVADAYQAETRARQTVAQKNLEFLRACAAAGITKSKTTGILRDSGLDEQSCTAFRGWMRDNNVKELPNGQILVDDRGWPVVITKAEKAKVEKGPELPQGKPAKGEPAKGEPVKGEPVGQDAPKTSKGDELAVIERAIHILREKARGNAHLLALLVDLEEEVDLIYER